MKNPTIGKICGWWCFAVTAVCCITGMYSADAFTMFLNVVTPIILTALGLIMPYLAKREKAGK